MYHQLSWVVTQWLTCDQLQYHFLSVQNIRTSQFPKQILIRFFKKNQCQLATKSHQTTLQKQRTSSHRSPWQEQAKNCFHQEPQKITQQWTQTSLSPRTWSGHYPRKRTTMGQCFHQPQVGQSMLAMVWIHRCCCWHHRELQETYHLPTTNIKLSTSNVSNKETHQ